MTSDTIDAVYVKLADLLKGFEDEGITIPKLKNVAYYSDAEFDFDSSTKS